MILNNIFSFVIKGINLFSVFIIIYIFNFVVKLVDMILNIV